MLDLAFSPPAPRPLNRQAPPVDARVLVVSESDLRRRELRAALVPDGHEVVEARTCLDALRLAGIGPARRADVVVLDTTGASWANVELLETLVEAGGPPVVALGEGPNACLARGACAALAWPLVASRLRAEVRRVVQPWLRTKE